MNKSLTIRDCANLIELACIERIAENLPCAGDLHISVTVNSNGFTGLGETWIASPEFSQFLTALRSLEETRDGHAVVESISPGEFRLEFLSTDKFGHMAVSGRISQRNHSLEYYFDFCPSLFPKITAYFDGLIAL